VKFGKLINVKMSRVGKVPIKIPDGVDVDISKSEIKVKGPKGELSMEIDPYIKVEKKEGEILVERKSDRGKVKAMHGTTRALIDNMIVGVTEGYERKLEMVGLGYRAKLQGKKLSLSVGLTHPVEFEVPESVNLELDGETKMTISGIDKQLVTQTAAKIRSFKKPEPYKGKGIRYEDEEVRRKTPRMMEAGEEI
jgi:large subunit ribosomal protein L6